MRPVWKHVVRLVVLLCLFSGCIRSMPGGPGELTNFLLYYTFTFSDLCGPLASDFGNIQPALAARMQLYMQYQASRGSSGTPSVRLFGQSFTGATKWEGGAMAPNGKIYGARYGSVGFLEIDPDTLTAAQVGPAGNTGSGLVLLPAGTLLEIPHTGTAINPVVLDPATGQTTQLSGSNSGAACSGGVLAPNGKVYCTAQSGTAGVLEISPDTGTMSLFGAAQMSNAYGGGAVLALNGKIYAVPFGLTAQLAEIDPATQTITKFGPSLTNLTYYGAVLAPSGKIYVIPFNGTVIYEVDPDTLSVTALGTFAGAGTYLTGALAPNGRIYLIPRNAASVIEFDPVTRSTTSFGSGWGTGMTAFDGGVLAANGKIYAIPLTGSGNVQQPLEIDPKSNGSFCGPVARAAYFNKF